MTPEERHAVVLAGLSRLGGHLADTSGVPWRVVKGADPGFFGVDIAGPAGAVAGHVGILDADVIVDLRNTAAAVLRGRRRIVERHAPTLKSAVRSVYATGPEEPPIVFCETCASLCHSSSGISCEQPTDGPWPCPDYLDAAADLLPDADG